MDSTTSLWDEGGASMSRRQIRGLGIGAGTNHTTAVTSSEFVAQGPQSGAGAGPHRTVYDGAFFYRTVRPQDSQDTICTPEPQPRHRYPPLVSASHNHHCEHDRRLHRRSVHRSFHYIDVAPSTPPLMSSANVPASPAGTLVNGGGGPFTDPASPACTIKDPSPTQWQKPFGTFDASRVALHHELQNEGGQHGNGYSAEHGTEPGPAPDQGLDGKKKGKRFWLIMGTLMIVMFLSAIDLTIISTALPTIVRDLPRSEISGTWVTSAFLLTVTAFQPLMGGLADVLGRRNSLLLSIAFFLGGSVICAVAKSMLVLVIGRGVQGVGGGGIQAIVEIIISDITTLRERGLYMGAMGLVFAISSLVAPILGGVFSRFDWRWIFLINLPIGGVASILCIPFLRLKTPPMKFRDQIHRMDIFGNMILLGSVIAILIAVTEGGVEHPWTDKRIWLSLTCGLCGLVLFFLIEFIPNPLARDPILPRRLFAHPTAAISFFLTFVHGIIFYGAVYILPVYFQAIKDASPLHSAFDILPSTSPSAPAAVIAGLIMALSGKYRLQMIGWWAVMAVGFGLICLFDIETPKWQWATFQLIAGTGVGALFALTLPPIQAALPVSEIAHATATFAFSRSFGSVWGIAISTAIFTSTVSPKLASIPGAAQVGLTGQTALGFATELWQLPEPIRQPAREAYAHALKKSLIFFVPLCGVGLVASFFIKDIPLPDFNDSQHGIRDSTLPPPRAKDPERDARGGPSTWSSGAQGATEKATMSHQHGPLPSYSIGGQGVSAAEMRQVEGPEQASPRRIRPLMMGRSEAANRHSAVGQDGVSEGDPRIITWSGNSETVGEGYRSELRPSQDRAHRHGQFRHPSAWSAFNPDHSTESA
ncbi:unnamed protein product [Parajaminaea phylloscopi]